MEYSKLQNGSDIRGIALGDNANLTEEAVRRLTRGFVMWLITKLEKKPNELLISVGMDSRISGPAIKKEIVETLSSIGVRVFDCGMASTPAMFMSTVFTGFKVDGAIMITASHLPSNRNGFKYFSKDGGLEKKDITNIVNYAESDLCITSLPKQARCGIVEEKNLIGAYSAFLREKIQNELGSEMPLKGLKIVVDCGNGAGGFYAKEILEPLGCDIQGSQFLEPDGTFPNHEPNPENKEAMASISKAVLDSKADLGLIFDTDVDRASAVDKNGKEISRNGIVALAASLISDEHKGSTVVTDSITSDELTVFLEKDLGLKHLRFKRGYRNVINKSIELNREGVESCLAIETSGHAAYKENYFLDDGAYLATKIVIKAGELKKRNLTIDRLIKDLKEPKEAKEIRIPIKAEFYTAYADVVLKDLEEWAKQNMDKGVTIVSPNYEGIRLNFNSEDLKGWLLLRKSLHDPLMPLNVEVTMGSCDKILAMLTQFFNEHEELEY